jgi:hypothetical protein
MTKWLHQITGSMMIVDMMYTLIIMHLSWSNNSLVPQDNALTY